VIRYNEHGIDGRINCWGSGCPPRLDPDEQAELYAIVMAGPDPGRGGEAAEEPPSPAPATPTTNLPIPAISISRSDASRAV
jgi:hypothetical protein